MAFDQVAYVREWRKRNVETVHEYRRHALLKRTPETGTFPRAASIRKYGITERNKEDRRLLLRAEAVRRAECVFARVVRVVPIKESMGGLDRFV